MKVKIATWNMAHWQYRGKTREAWAYLDDVIAPDIALVQEAAPPANQVRSETCVWREIGDTRKWGSGVLTKRFPLREVQFETTYPGSVVAADVDIPGESSLTAISLYGIFDKWNYVMTGLHRMFSDLTPLLVGLMGKRRIVLGGDFNASLQADERWGGEAHRIFFKRVADFGLVDCLAKFHSGFVQTHRHRISDIPWQNDYIFVSKELEDCLLSCEALDNTDVHELSDHNPVVAVLDL
jgi:exonuclease III